MRTLINDLLILMNARATNNKIIFYIVASFAKLYSTKSYPRWPGFV